MGLNSFLRVALLLLLLLSLLSCNHNKIPSWDADLHGGIWVGSSKDGGLVRKQFGQVCKGDQECMDNMVAFTQEGLESFTSTYVLGCKEWKKGVPTTTVSEAVKKLQAAGAFSSHEMK